MELADSSEFRSSSVSGGNNRADESSDNSCLGSSDRAVVHDPPPLNFLVMYPKTR